MTINDPAGTWAGMATLRRTLPKRSRAMLLVSGHWEKKGFVFTGAAAPSLIYDYRGVPPRTYTLRYDAPDAPALATQAARRLAGAGIAASVNPARGCYHGVLIPLKVSLPDAEVPVVEMSVDCTLDAAPPRRGLRAGAAARLSQPDAEHLLPLMVAVGALDGRGTRI